MTLLLLSLAVTFVGPTLAWGGRRIPGIASGTDAFIVIALAGLVFFHLLPEALSTGGILSAVAAFAGFVLLPIAERVALRDTKKVRNLVLMTALVGLLLHAFTDGAALSVLSFHSHGQNLVEHHTEHHGDTLAFGLAFGVILHRLPVALGVFWVGQAWSSARAGWAALFVLGGCTVAGYHTGIAYISGVQPVQLAIFEAFVAGSLLHVVLSRRSIFSHHEHVHPTSANAEHSTHAHDQHHHAHDQHHHAHDQHQHGHGNQHSHSDHHGHIDHHDHSHRHGPHSHSPGLRSDRYGYLVGSVFAALGLYVMSHSDMHVASRDNLSTLETLRVLLLESSPALVIAYVGAGLFSALVGDSAQKWLGGNSLTSQASRGVAFGLPLPICSCGVLPMYETLITRGVPTAGAVAFLVATPELGLDAILISVPLLGPDLTLARILSAASAAIILGYLAGRFLGVQQRKTMALATDNTPLQQRLKTGLRFGLIELVDHTAPWIFFGLVAAALIEPLVDYDQLASLPAYFDIPIFALIGVPVYVCATGATPLAAVLIHKGVSPGAAIAFLLTGPATNLTTFGVFSRLHGKRPAFAFATGMFVVAVLLGGVTNYVLGTRIDRPLHDLVTHEATLFEVISLIMLAALALGSIWRRGPRSLLSEVHTSTL